VSRAGAAVERSAGGPATAEASGVRGVLLDWRGTLVVAPTYPWLVRTALQRLGRPQGDDAVERVLARLGTADPSTVESSDVDTDAGAHREAYLAWFRTAGIDPELAQALYAVESDVSSNAFADDVGELMDGLRAAGVRVGVVSDIHVDLRPVFAAHRLPDGTSWADLVQVWVLSFEVGVAKPDPRIFEIALDRLGLPAEQVLMVGDRAGWDGAATGLGMTTLLLPPLQEASQRRLHRVLRLVDGPASTADAR
jgi:FMN phosphatase YigB (HAD superfamily)